MKHVIVVCSVVTELPMFCKWQGLLEAQAHSFVLHQLKENNLLKNLAVVMYMA